MGQFALNRTCKLDCGLVYEQSSAFRSCRPCDEDEYNGGAFWSRTDASCVRECAYVGYVN